MFEKMGFHGEGLNSCVETITADKEVWYNFLTKSELGIDEPENPTVGAILTFIAFTFGAFIPLFPYLLNLGIISMIISSAMSFGMLFVVGALKTSITGEKRIKGAIEMLIIGCIAFVVSFGIGLLLDNLLVF